MSRRKQATPDPFRVHSLLDALEESGALLRDANQGPDVPIGLWLPDDLAPEDAEKLLAALLFLEGELSTFFKFATGDVFRAMQKTAGGKRYRIERLFGRGAYHSLRNRAYMAGQFLAHRRVPGISWETYRALAGADSRTKDYWLAEVKRGDLTPDQIRAFRKQEKAQKGWNNGE